MSENIRAPLFYVHLLEWLTPGTLITCFGKTADPSQPQASNHNHIRACRPSPATACMRTSVSHNATLQKRFRSEIGSLFSESDNVHVLPLFRNFSPFDPWMSLAVLSKGDERDVSEPCFGTIEWRWSGQCVVLSLHGDSRRGKVGEFPFVARSWEVVDASVSGETDRMGAWLEVGILSTQALTLLLRRIRFLRRGHGPGAQRSVEDLAGMPMSKHVQECVKIVWFPVEAPRLQANDMVVDSPVHSVENRGGSAVAVPHQAPWLVKSLCRGISPGPVSFEFQGENQVITSGGDEFFDSGK